MKVRVKYDFSKFQPTWTPSFSSIFGENNEGMELNVKSKAEAKEIMRYKHRVPIHQY